MSAASSPARRLLPEGLQPESLVVDLSGLTVRAGVAAAYAWCPVCERRSQRVHSHYERTVSDLPWRSVSVTLKVRARRFFCANKECEIHLLRAVARDRRPRDRKSTRLNSSHANISYAV